VCGSVPPFIHPNLANAFCGNDECNVLMWDPWSTAKENLEDMGEVKIISDEKQN
jgi:hypothetical protein